MTQPTILITGASRGLGAATARAVAQLGAHVVISARSAAELEAVAAAIVQAGDQATAVVGDVGKPDDCERMVAAALAATGRLDALINNAGVIHPIAPIAAAEATDWEALMRVNLLGPVQLTRLALPHLRASRGRVIHVSSGAAVTPIAGWGAYCASKAALNHFSRVLAIEEPEIISLTFRPGVVDTAMQAVIRVEGRKGMPEGEHGRFVSMHHEGRLLPPELPARALAALALFAPREWSGDFVQWDDARVQVLKGEVGQ